MTSLTFKLDFYTTSLLEACTVCTRSFTLHDEMTDVKDGDEHFASSLELRLEKRSDQLEEIHLEAAIDAELTVLGGSASNARPVIEVQHEKNQVIFDDYTNPNAVANCLSPYVPSSADRIQSFVKWVDLALFDSHGGDVLLDLGCGDGRVCITACKLSGKITLFMIFFYLDVSFVYCLMQSCHRYHRMPSGWCRRVSTLYFNGQRGGKRGKPVGGSVLVL